MTTNDGLQQIQLAAPSMRTANGRSCFISSPPPPLHLPPFLYLCFYSPFCRTARQQRPAAMPGEGTSNAGQRLHGDNGIHIGLSLYGSL
uniref:Uncharacterized protein n=1 Tax=Solanum lycopersicum TaxID=4081 RepID=A0A3Q7GU68_SOLLC